jgi:hypothetical protein
MKKFSVDCINKAGEHITVIVGLDEFEWDDIKHNRRTGDLIARSYAMRHARRSAPGFDPVIETIQPIQIH